MDHFSRFNERRIAPFRRYNYFKDRVSFLSSRLLHGGRSNFFKDFFKDRDDFFSPNFLHGRHHCNGNGNDIFVFLNFNGNRRFLNSDNGRFVYLNLNGNGRFHCNGKFFLDGNWQPISFSSNMYKGFRSRFQNRFNTVNLRD